jgi:hypothetical protein
MLGKCNDKDSSDIPVFGRQVDERSHQELMLSD